MWPREPEGPPPRPRGGSCRSAPCRRSGRACARGVAHPSPGRAARRSPPPPSAAGRSRDRTPPRARARGPGRTGPGAGPRPARSRSPGPPWSTPKAAIRYPSLESSSFGSSSTRSTGNVTRPITGSSSLNRRASPRGPWTVSGRSRCRSANVFSIPGSPSTWSAWKWVMNRSSSSISPTELISWRWVPSPQSISSRSPPRRMSVAGSPRRGLGDEPAVPRKRTSRSMWGLC